MPDAATLPIGDGGGPLSNPRYLVIGAGAIIVAVFLIASRRSQPAVVADTPAPNALAGPNAALAIGSLESRLQEISGHLETQVQTSGAGIENALSAGFGGMSTQAQTNYLASMHALNVLGLQNADIDTLVRGGINANRADFDKMTNQQQANYLATMHALNVLGIQNADLDTLARGTIAEQRASQADIMGRLAGLVAQQAANVTDAGDGSGALFVSNTSGVVGRAAPASFPPGAGGAANWWPAY